MSTLLVVNGAPYGGEAPYDAFRLAEAVALHDEAAEAVLMGDAGDDLVQRVHPAMTCGPAGGAVAGSAPLSF